MVTACFEGRSVKAVRITATVVLVLVTALAVLTIANSIPGIKQAMGNIKPTIEVPCVEIRFIAKCGTTTTTLPQWDSGDLRVNQYGSSDKNGDYSLTSGTKPNTPGTIYQNVMPTIPENQPYETFPPTQGGN